MEGASAKIACSDVKCMDIIRKNTTSECIGNCNFWFEMALQVLRKNQVHPYVFAEAFHSLLVGRVKHRTLMVIVINPANCGKRFLFHPLSKSFNVFQSCGG